MKIKNKTAGHAGIACFSFALKGNRAGSPHFKIIRFKWWEHVTTVVGNMPGYEGISIYVADQKTGEIYGATDATKIGVTFTISSDNESNLAVILLLAVYLALASAVILFMLSKVFKANREKNEQFAVLASMSEIYHRMYLVDLETDSVIAYSSREKMEKMGKWNKNADDMMHRIMKETAIEAYREQADLHTVAERMKGKNSSISRIWTRLLAVTTEGLMRETLRISLRRQYSRYLIFTVLGRNPSA